MQSIVARMVAVTIVLIAGVLLLASCAGRVYQVVGPDMEPTYPSGQMITAVPVATDALTRGDPIIYRLDNGEMYFNRVVGLPGETVLIARGRVFVNGAPLDEPYISADGTDADTMTALLGDDEYYILGDNRPASFDSRHHGPVEGDHIVGRVKVTMLNRLTSW